MPSVFESNSLPNKKTTTKISKETSLCVFTQLTADINYIITRLKQYMQIALKKKAIF